MNEEVSKSRYCRSLVLKPMGRRQSEVHICDKYIAMEDNFNKCSMSVFRFVLNVLSAKVAVLQPQEQHTMRLGLTISLCVMIVECSWTKETTAPFATRLMQMTDWDCKMIQCSTCNSWVHAKCEGLTGT